VKYAYNDESKIGAFQVWSGGLELAKTIDLGGERRTRDGLRGRKLQQTGKVYTEQPKNLPKVVGPTVKYAYNDESKIGAFQVWSGGLELAKTIDLGGERRTRDGLRGRKLQQTGKVYTEQPKNLPKVVGPTVKYAYNDESKIGAFQVWSGGLELAKTIDLGGERRTRDGLRGKH
jgi:hypothetical protein